MNILDSAAEKLHLKELRYFPVIAMAFVSILLISNVASSKIIEFGPFEFDGGTLLFPLSYVFGDILTEVYGYRRTRKVIWTGLIMAFLMAAVFMIVGALPAAEGWVNQGAYNAILGWTPRIVLASVIAYAAGEFSNSYILAKLKVRMEGKKLWVRTIGSTIIGEGLDTVLFVVIAFYGVLPDALLISILFSNYIFKVLIEVAFTPLTYLVVDLLKSAEGIDVYDKHTNFNPFKLN